MYSSNFSLLESLNFLSVTKDILNVEVSLNGTIPVRSNPETRMKRGPCSVNIYVGLQRGGGEDRGCVKSRFKETPPDGFTHWGYKITRYTWTTKRGSVILFLNFGGIITKKNIIKCNE
jgi:hypothetical protein